MKIRSYLFFIIFFFLTILKTQAQIAPASFVGNPDNWLDKTDLAKIGANEGFTVLTSESKISSSKPSGFGWRFKLGANGYVELPELTNLGTFTIFVAGGSGTQAGGTTLDYDSLRIEKWVEDPETETLVWQLQKSVGKAMPKAETIIRYDYDCNTSSPVKLRVFNASGLSIWVYCMQVTPYGESVETTLPYTFVNADMPSPTAGSVPEPTSTGTWQSNMLGVDNAGKLQYIPDNDGFILPDFSHAGYMNGNAPIPDVPVVKTLTAIDGDNTAQIQAAINEVGAMPLGNDGIRGALLLKKGLYEVKGPIYVNYDGVVLRGEGNGSDPLNNTVIYDSFRDADGYSAWRSVLLLGNKTTDSWNTNKTDVENILNDVVPVGSNVIRIARNNNYKVGDLVCVYHPCSEAWLAAINYGDVGNDPTAYKPWTTSSAPISYHRYVKGVTHSDVETVIELDAPVFYTLRKSLSQSTIYRFTRKAMQNIGLENLRVDCAAKTIPDENHVWNSIGFKNADNCWARNVVAIHFGQAGFFTETSTAITIEHCYALDPVGVVTGERMYNFNNAHHSQFVLFKDCYARSGRHNYVSNGTSSVSGCVVYNCKSEGSRASSEGHRLWTQGMLFDKYQDFNPISSSTVAYTLGFYNRWQMGSGHGWAMANGVMWNCNMVTDHSTPEAQRNSSKASRSGIYCEKPPTSQNYAIGCFVEAASEIKVYKKTIGYVEGTNTPGLYPSSLYEAQLAARQESPTDVKPINNPKVFIYLNPSRTELNIRHSLPVKSVSIIDLNGRKLYSQKSEQLNTTVSLNFLAAGVYFVRVETTDGIQNYKIVK